MKKLGVSLLVGLTFAMLLFGCGKEKAEERRKRGSSRVFSFAMIQRVWKRLIHSRFIYGGVDVFRGSIFPVQRRV